MLTDGKYLELDSSDPVRAGAMSVGKLRLYTHMYIALACLLWVLVLTLYLLHRQPRLWDFVFAFLWTAFACIWLSRLRRASKLITDNSEPTADHHA
ncbi:MAG: hypothetical protein NVS9B15_25900 [Acidobacteriaceae bacterium]